MRAPISSGARRLYLTMNTAMSTAMRMREERREADEEQVQPSTRLAIVDATSGNRGIVPDRINKGLGLRAQSAGFCWDFSRRTITTMKVPIASTVATPATRNVRITYMP